MFKRLFIAILTILATNAAHAAAIKSDFVFIIDATGSMAGEIAGVRAGFSSFVAGLDANAVDARFAVVVFGGEAELTLDLTSDAAATQTALNNIVIGSNAFQNNHNVNPEAGLEAIRMALGAAPFSNLANNHIAADGLLNFRTDARINLILATDEDSDNPFHAANRFGNQDTTDASDKSPPSTGPNSANWASWQAEVDATAQAVIDNQAYVNMLMNRGDSPSISQYGDYNADVADADLLNFDAAATLANLTANTLSANSLQAQVLGSNADLIARTFNVAGANNSDFIDNFFAAKLEEVITDPCQIDPDSCGTAPEPGTLALLALGLIGFRFSLTNKV